MKVVPQPGGASGTYTPTGTVVTNLDSVTPGVCMYAQVGNTVYVNGLTVIDPTANALSQWRLTLPVTSNLAAVADLSGGAVSGTAFLGWVYGDATNDAAAFDFGACGTAATNVRFWFSYRVL